MPEVILTIGPPGSGKNTWANNFIAKKQKTGKVYRIVNRDDLRAMSAGGIHNYKYSNKSENIITQTQLAMAKALIAAGQSVIVCDTNLSAIAQLTWKEFCIEHNICLQKENFITNYLNENANIVKEHGENWVLRQYEHRCQQWNLKRVDSVPPAVITSMFEKYIYRAEVQHQHHDELPNAWVFDIDGTLALMNGKRKPFDWDKVGVDDVDSVISYILKMHYKTGDTIIILSGRDGVCEPETRQWLSDNLIPFHHLWMRLIGDQRKDDTVKWELFMNHIEGNFNVQAIYDDRDSVVANWRRHGIKCLQVAPGAF